MSEKFLIGFGVLVSIVAIIVVIFSSDDVELPQLSQLEETVVSVQNVKNSSDLDIVYTQKIAPAERIVSTPVASTLIEEDENVENKTFTADGLYEIALINPNKSTQEGRTGRLVAVKGKIDGRIFNLKVPQVLIERREADIELRVTNKKTGEIQTTPANFLDDLTNISARHFIDVDVNDIDNINYESKKSILPLPGVPQNDD